MKEPFDWLAQFALFDCCSQADVYELWFKLNDDFCMEIPDWFRAAMESRLSAL